MPQFDSRPREDTGEGFSRSALGLFGAIPGANIITPGLTQAIGQTEADYYRNAELNNAGAIETPRYESGTDVNAQYAGDVNPTLYGTPEAAQSTLAQESPEGRAAQLAALQDLSRVTDQSVGANQAQRRYQAAQDAAQFANSREQAIKQDAMSRGKVGGTADMLSREQAAQAGANRDLGGGLQSAQQAALEELAGTQAKGALAGSMRGQDQNLAFTNADILNKFSQYNTGARNAAAQHNADTLTATAAANRGAQQDYLNNQTALGMGKLNRNDRNANAGFASEMGKYGAVNDALEGKANAAVSAAANTRAAGAEGFSNFQKMMQMMGGMG